MLVPVWSGTFRPACNAYGHEDDGLLNMNNRGRGRPPRRRGFDDDFAFDRAPPGDLPRPVQSWPSSAGFGPEHDATVKWFNPEKGFGFVALSDGSGDAFLHANTLNAAGHAAVSPGASLRVELARDRRDVRCPRSFRSTKAPRPRVARRLVRRWSAWRRRWEWVAAPRRAVVRPPARRWKCRAP